MKNEIIIKPNRTWLYLDWRGLVNYRDLLFLLVRRDFVSRYKQTILGPAWFVIQPLLTTLVFNVIFNKIANIPTDNIPPMLFYLSGLVSWDYFARCVNATQDSFRANAGLYGKVYFPRLVIPISAVFSNIFAFLIQLGTFLAFFAYFKYFTTAGAKISPNLFILLLPAVLLQTAALGLGVGLWVSALTAKYRDLSFLMGFLVTLWMYVTPLVYPMSIVPGRLRFILALNPMFPIVELFRTAFFGTPFLGMNYLSISAIASFVILITGIFVFNRIERTFIDTV